MSDWRVAVVGATASGKSICASASAGVYGANGFSNSPARNFTRRILRTASSMRRLEIRRKWRRHDQSPRLIGNILERFERRGGAEMTAQPIEAFADARFGKERVEREARQHDAVRHTSAKCHQACEVDGFPAGGGFLGRVGKWPEKICRRRAGHQCGRCHAALVFPPS